jgi:hypothetical protein
MLSFRAENLIPEHPERSASAWALRELASWRR